MVDMLAAVRRDATPQVSFVYLCRPDLAGHDHGWDTDGVPRRAHARRRHAGALARGARRRRRRGGDDRPRGHRAQPRHRGRRRDGRVRRGAVGPRRHRGRCGRRRRRSTSPRPSPIWPASHPTPPGRARPCSAANARWSTTSWRCSASVRTSPTARTSRCSTTHCNRRWRSKRPAATTSSWSPPCCTTSAISSARPGPFGNPDHAEAAARFLRPWLPATVVEPIRLHVAAKRHLVGTTPDYAAGLSDASRVTLDQQGGPFDDAASAAFLGEPHAERAIRLRTCDDRGKRADVERATARHAIDRVIDAALATPPIDPTWARGCVPVRVLSSLPAPHPRAARRSATCPVGWCSAHAATTRRCRSTSHVAPNVTRRSSRRPTVNAQVTPQTMHVERRAAHTSASVFEAARLAVATVFFDSDAAVFFAVDTARLAVVAVARADFLAVVAVPLAPDFAALTVVVAASATRLTVASTPSSRRRRRPTHLVGLRACEGRTGRRHLRLVGAGHEGERDPARRSRHPARCR